MMHISPAQKSADLISLVAYDIWETSPATATPTRVKGHADKQYPQLTLVLETLNCIVDSEAKQFLSIRKM